MDLKLSAVWTLQIASIVVSISFEALLPVHHYRPCQCWRQPCKNEIRMRVIPCWPWAFLLPDTPAASAREAFSYQGKEAFSAQLSAFSDQEKKLSAISVQLSAIKNKKALS